MKITSLNKGSHVALETGVSPKPGNSIIYDGVALFLLWTTAVYLQLGGLTADEFWWTDESRHAMDGVFFMDLFREHPWNNLYEFTVNYFVHYPAIALNWYPPLFAAVESLFFAIFGITEIAAHLSVLAFTLFGITAWYLWSYPIWGRIASILSIILFLSIPEVALWSRSVMLEIPAWAMIAISVLTFDRYLILPTVKRASLAGGALALTLLLKQTTIFIIPALVVYGFKSGYGDRFFRREAFLAYFVVALTILGLFIHAVKFGTTATHAIGSAFSSKPVFGPSLLSINRWEINLLALLKVSGVMLSFAFIAGILTFLRSPPAPQEFLLGFWIVAWYLMVTALIFEGNADRYTLYVLPAFSLLACRTFSNLISLKGTFSTTIGWSILVSLVGIALWNVYTTATLSHPYVSGYKEAAGFVSNGNFSGPILFAGKHDGNFIFHMRADDPNKNKIVLRGDKILLSMAVTRSYGVQSYVRNREDIMGILDRYGIEVIVVEDRDLVGLREFNLLRDVLRAPEFQLLKTIPIDTNIPELRNTNILVYRYMNRKLPQDDYLTIPLPHLRREIRYKIN